MLSQLKWISLLTVLTGVLATAKAQTASLSLEDCINLAMAAPSPASLAERQTAIAGEQQTIARSAFLPQVNLSNGFVYNSPLQGTDQMSFVVANGIREYRSTVNSTWEIDLSGRLRAGLALARAQRELAEVEWSLTRRDLRRAVAVSFYDVLLARKLVELEQAGLDEAKDFESLTRLRQQQGEGSMADVHKAAAQRSRFEQRLDQARLSARLANQILASFWTSDADHELELSGALEPPQALPVAISQTSSTLVDTTVQRRPEFDRLDALQSGFQAQRAAARAALRPQADLVFQYGIDSNNVRLADRGYEAFFRLNVPVFDWFRSRGAARQALYREEQVEQEQAIAKRTFTREYLAARARVQSWYRRVPMAESELADAGENLRLARLLYRSGEGLALDVVTAQTEVTDAGTSYFNAVAAYQRSLVDFEVASGQ